MVVFRGEVPGKNHPGVFLAGSSMGEGHQVGFSRGKPLEEATIAGIVSFSWRSRHGENRRAGFSREPLGGQRQKSFVGEVIGSNTPSRLFAKEVYGRGERAAADFFKFVPLDRTIRLGLCTMEPGNLLWYHGTVVS